MKFISPLLLILFLNSCSIKRRTTQNQNKNTFSYFLFKDLSGEYIVKREVSVKKNETALRQTLFQAGKELEPLEKSVSITKYGVVGKGSARAVAARPVASQYSIWFEKKEFFSQFKLNFKTKGFDVYLKSPEEKWKGKQFISIPKASKFCWYSQIPECIKKLVKLESRSRKPTGFYIVWDNFPYYSEQYQGLSGNAYSVATVVFDGEFDKSYRYAVAVDNQLIFYHYNFELEFEKMLWIAQGVTMIKEARKGML